MKQIAIFLLFFWPLTLFAKINIFTCQEEWYSLAKEITRDRASIFNAVKGNQDSHYIQVKPSLIAKIRNADIIFCTGSNLEEGWLPLLLDKSYKKHAKDVNRGYLLASNYVEKLEVIDSYSLSRSMGHIHPAGNPHIHLDPRNIIIIAQELTNRLKIIDNENSQFYQNNFDNFTIKWQDALNNWGDRIKKLQTIKIISNHKAWSYLLNWLNIELIATIEEKPGIAPGARHLANLIKLANSKQVDYIIYAPFEASKRADWISNNSKAKAIELPFSIDQKHNVNNLFDLFGQIISKLEADGNLQ